VTEKFGKEKKIAEIPVLTAAIRDTFPDQLKKITQSRKRTRKELQGPAGTGKKLSLSEAGKESTTTYERRGEGHWKPFVHFLIQRKGGKETLTSLDSTTPSNRGFTQKGHGER